MTLLNVENYIRWCNNEMAEYFNVSNIQDNFGSDNTVTQNVLHCVVERTHVLWVLGWCLATPHYGHCKPPLSKQLRLIWLPQEEEGT
jgi:hypothetical protein